MRKYIMLSSFITSALLFSVIPQVAGAQTNMPGKLQPVETVCKDVYDWRGMASPFGIIVGEAYHPSCSGSGKNAWQTKFLESEDIVCTQQGRDLYENHRAWNSIKSAYNIVGEGKSSSCPTVANSSFNTTHIKLKPTDNPEKGPISGYVADKYISVTNGVALWNIKIPGVEEIACRRKEIGYIHKGHGTFDKKCSMYPNEKPSGYGNATHIKIPGNVEKGIKLGGMNVPFPFIVFNTYKTPLEFMPHVSQPLHDIKRPTEVYESVCRNNFLHVPTGYRVVSQVNYDNRCAGAMYVLKKISDDVETICSSLPAGGLSTGQTIPITYAKTANIANAQCPGTGNNAWQLKRIKDDTN